MALIRQYTPEESAAYVASQGGIEKMFAGAREHRERQLRLDSRREELTRKYPDQWVALAPGDELVVADTIDALYAEIDTRGIERDSCVARRMRTKPLRLII